MKKLSLVLSGIVAVSLLTGCSQKNTPPTEVKTWDRGASLSVSKSLVLEEKREVPKDQFLVNKNWTYQIVATKKGNYLLDNDQIVKTFYVAHHAQDIIIVGREGLIEQYKNYFVSNGVKGKITLQPVTPIQADTNTVNMLFFNKKSAL